MPAVAGIGLEGLIATQALAGGGGTHRQAQNARPQAAPRLCSAKITLPPPPTRKSGKKTQEEEFGWKLLKKIQRKRHPMFKPPVSSGFQNAARIQGHAAFFVLSLGICPAGFIINKIPLQS